MSGLESGARKLWCCNASNQQMMNSNDDSIPVQIAILIPAPDRETAERYADLLCGGNRYHGFVEEVTKGELFDAKQAKGPTSDKNILH